MKSSRAKRQSSRSNHGMIEALESRRLLSATLGTAVASQTLAAGASSTVDLTTHFSDPQVTGTEVVLQTPLGKVALSLTDSETPATVQNFLHYVDNGEYTGTVIHRSVPGFVIQGGGYTTSGNHITTLGAIAGEHDMSNTTGTIAMALSTGPDSATSEWFINLANNTELDDTSDGGPFTAFGTVIDGGMTVVNDIQSLPIVDNTSVAAENTLPVLAGTNGSTVTSEPANNQVTVDPTVFSGAHGLTYSVASSKPTVVTASVNSAGQLTLSSPGRAGTAVITVTATDAGGNVVTNRFAAAVPSTTTTTSDVTASGNAIAAVRGAAVTATVATFTDSDLSTTTGDYSAQISWGDGTTSAGTINAGGAAGSFSVAGTHTYASAGSYATTVTITPDTGTGGTASGSAVVRRPATTATLTAAGITGLTFVRGTEPTVAVATFANTDLSLTAASYTATIDWGDGTSSAGTVDRIGAVGHFQVVGTHTYSSAGAFTTTTLITPATGTAATAVGSATVRRPATTGTTILAVGVTGGKVFRGTAATAITATFLDSVPSIAAAAYMASIDWGDGTTSAGTVATDHGRFEVLGTHTYGSAAVYTVTTTITAPGESDSATATGNLTARRPT